MNKIQNHIITIEKWLDRFDKNTFLNGRNKAIREKAGREIDLVLFQANNYFDANEDLRTILFDFHGGNYFGYDESLSFQWFDRDMPGLLTKLRELQSESEKDKQQTF